MYRVDGDFGQVRLSEPIPTLYNQGLFLPEMVGWHKCNDRYVIDRPHGVGFHLVLFTVVGTGMITINGVTYQAQPGTITFIPKNTPCHYETPKDGIWEFYWFHSGSKPSELFLDSVALNSEPIKKYDPLMSYPSRMETFLSLSRGTSWQEMLTISATMSEFLHEIALLFCEDKSQTLSQRIIDYFEQHYAENISIEQMANHFYASAAHLIRTFRKETGFTPYRFLINLRIQKASQRLRFTNLSIEEISDQVGFASASHFIATFRQIHHCTPTKFRELYTLS